MNIPQKGFALPLLIVLIAILLTGGGAYGYVRYTQPSSVVDSATETALSLNSETTGWRTYANSEYNFSIQYPCDTACQSSQPTAYKNAYVEDEIWLPTGTPANVLISTFTDADVNEWNDSVSGTPGYPFPFSLSSIREALKLPVGSVCKISSSYSKRTHDCTTVLIRGEKAVQVISGVFKASYENRVYFFDRGGDKWLEVIEVYATDDPFGFLLDESLLTPEIRKEMKAISEVITTLTF